MMLTFIIVFVSLIASIGITSLIQLFLTQAVNRKGGFVCFFILYFLHFTFWMSAPHIESNQIKSLEYLLYVVLSVILIKYFFEGKSLVNFTFIYATDGIIQAFVLSVMVLKAGSMQWMNQDMMKHWADQISKNTVFLLVYAIAVSLVISYIMIRFYGKHNNSFTYFCYAAVAATHILMEAARCTENLLVVAPLIIILLIAGIVAQDRKITDNERYEKYYKLLEERQQKRHKTISEVQSTLNDSMNTADSLPGEFIENEINKKADYIIRTGLPIIDFMIEDKEKICSENNIEFSGHWCDLSNANITSYDLVCILSVLINKAIECCQRNAMEKTITYEIKREEELFYFYICNHKKPTVSPSKKRKIIEGENILSSDYGPQLIRKITRKYNGSASFEDNAKEIKATIVLKLWSQDIQ